MDQYLSSYESANERKGKIISVVINTILLALMLIPLLTYPNPPPGQEGVTVNLGIPDIGQGEESGPQSQPEKEVAPPSEPEEEVRKPEPEVTPPPKVEPEPTPEPKVEKPKVVTEDPRAIALKKRKEQEAREKAEKADQQRQERIAEQQRKDQERREQERIAAEKKRKADAAAAAAAAEAKKRSDMEGLFNGNGPGKGDTGKPGTGGVRDGEPNADNTTGRNSGGAGKVGGGLNGRGVQSSPTIDDPSNKTGRVNLKVCVDASGKVVSVEWDQQGSSTPDPYLINLAKKNAYKWRFKASSDARQCGSIAYTFEVQ